MERAFYAGTVAEFLSEKRQSIIGILASSQPGDLTPAQRVAWERQVDILKNALSNHPEGTLLFEYVIPRMGRRVDNILLSGNTVLVIEFKVGATMYDRAAIDQVTDYALDLKNFHFGSRNATVVPILIATHAHAVDTKVEVASDGVSQPLLASIETSAYAIQQACAAGDGPTICPDTWLASGYNPTPTIIQASQALYRGHSVEEIAHSEAGAINLKKTIVALDKIIDRAAADREKAICLITGVPGAGKTLAGLHLASSRRRVEQEHLEHAVFLSGNGPLVQVLQEALARDEVEQKKAQGLVCKKKDAKRRAESFIQNIHHFRDDALTSAAPPAERVVIFDEAQRAWDQEQTCKFMRQKKGHPEFDRSEPSFLVSVLDRHVDWAVIICLIGSGQEINRGEAGLDEWLRVLRDEFPEWSIYTPPNVESQTYTKNLKIDELAHRIRVEPSLHLGISIRSFRSEALSLSISALLSGRLDEAKTALGEVTHNYPIVITRSVERAKDWVRHQSRGTERYGLLASSGARRLKPLGLHINAKLNASHWFLGGPEDVRSSFYLEDAASEFEIQGLEIDWAVLVWDADLIRNADKWLFQEFKGTKWQNIRSPQGKRYRLNAYRVLMTRARQGMAIVVPEGDARDPTRNPSLYEPTWKYLKSLGLAEL